MPPLAVRVQVAERQLGPDAVDEMYAASSNLTQKLKRALEYLGLKSPCLDHDPALILRPYNSRIKDVASRYTPHAHDPDALIYREKANHQQKTTGRKPGAERTITTKGSDIGLKAKFARLEGRTKPRPKQKIPKRPFQKGRKFDARR